MLYSNTVLVRGSPLLPFMVLTWLVIIVMACVASSFDETSGDAHN